ncbi:hypothetical protein Sste5346_005858 [Sporothrix stenoceras]|uniref:FAD dependent oxidoreductase domain-containing protein n=1 Tax=Sporothrix stenoceras TaxID=5173 RepID=A0ABR3Z2C7_9PEZI
MATVIIGAGIVGVTTAYYMAENNHDAKQDIHLVETTPTLFASASGYAGGFMARDWMAPDSASLAALSFDQHAALAAQHDGERRWGYALSTALSYGLPGGAKEGQRGEDWLRQGTSRSTAAPAVEGGSKKSVPSWLNRTKGDRVEVLADDGTAGQVEPEPFCQYLLDQSLKKGVRLHQPATVVGVQKDDSGKLASITIEENGTQTVLACTRLVITAGAWTPRVYSQLFPEAAARRPLPVHNYAGHSLVVKPSQKRAEVTDRFALFAAGGSMQYCPEIFGRANGTLYLAGLNSSTIPLPATAADSVPSQDQLDDLLKTCKRILGEDDDDKVEVVRTGLCHRPATPWGAPLLLRLLDGKLAETSTDESIVSGDGGVFASAGHGPWGISMGPGTGMVLAELVQGRPLSADIKGLGFH